MLNKAVIYLDHAATTGILPEVVDAMIPYLKNKYANPSSVYGIACENRAVINNCRKKLAESIGANENEIYFTSGGSESDNWAIKGVAEMYGRRSGHIITSKIEHPAVLKTCRFLEDKGIDVTYLSVDENGLIKLRELEKAIRPDTFLISIMYANNEIGTIEPIREIGGIAHSNNILFHTDAVQAYGHVPIDVSDCNIDLLSASGHKINGPKGIGFLYVREGVNIGRLIHGGGQERGIRAGTENVPAIAGLSKACEISVKTMKTRATKEIFLRDHLIDRILYEVPYTRLNGHRINRLPNNVNISFQFLQGESLLVLLDMYGICASAGSACSAGLQKPSHVLMALGLPVEIANGSIRMTLGLDNTLEEIDYVADKIKLFAQNLRELSPQYEDYRNKRV